MTITEEQTQKKKAEVKKLIEVIVDLAQSHPKHDLNDFLEYREALMRIERLLDEVN